MMSYAPLLPLAFLFLGAVLASFAGVIAERLNTGESWVQGHSRCNSCSRELMLLDLIPVLSWVFTRGRCRTCHAPVPYLYALVECTLALLFFASYEVFGLSLHLLIFLPALFLLTIIVLYDLRHTIVPFWLSCGFVASSAFFAVLASASPRELGLTLISAGAIGLGFFLMHVLSSGRWMGLGDAPIALGLSLLAGSHAFPGLLFSFWIGGALGIIILVLTPRGHRMNSEVPFVPFLAAGFLLALFTQWTPFTF